MLRIAPALPTRRRRRHARGFGAAYVLSLAALPAAACGGDGKADAHGHLSDAGVVDAAANPDVGNALADVAAPKDPITFHCRFDAGCPGMSIAGDPVVAGPFRGYGDPTLENDPSGALWLGYSWLDQQPLPGSPTPLNAVRTHLARSDDGGSTFGFVRALNVATPAPNNTALVIHEVSTLARRPDGTWHDAWLTYGLLPSGDRAQFFYERSTAASADALGASIDPWLRGTATTVATALAATSIAGAGDCVAFTEPALFTHGGVSYLATSCVVDPTRAETQRLLLLREDGSSLTLVGDLLNSSDAAALGGTRIEQIDLSIAKDETVLALVTPIDDGAAVPHRGCVALEVENLATARVRRDAAGHLVRRAVITADGTGIGPGLCTYDRASATGILITLTQVAGDTIEFSLHATGVHP